MPRSALKPCNKTGCNALTRSRYCDKHKFNEQRANSHRRGYDRAWRNLSERCRKANPLCESCKEQNKLKPVDLVDHIIPVHIAPHRRLDMSNLQSLCYSCHREKTDRDIQEYGSNRTALRGQHRAASE